jgi:ferredoxin
MDHCSGSPGKSCSCRLPTLTPARVKLLWIDVGGCVGCGLCEQTCPEVFEMTAGGVARLREEMNLDEIPTEALQDVVEICPQVVVHLEVEDG